MLCSGSKQQSINISYPPSPQQQSRRTLLQQANGTDKKWKDRQTEMQINNVFHFIQPARHTMHQCQYIIDLKYGIKKSQTLQNKTIFNVQSLIFRK